MQRRHLIRVCALGASALCLGKVRLSAQTAEPSTTNHPVLQVITLDEQPWYEARDRAVARELASPRNSKARAMSIAAIKIPAGVEVVPHHHVMEEVYHIVAGEGTMRVEDETRVVRAGQSVVLAPHQWHNITNHTHEELRLLVVCAPAWAPEHLIFNRHRMPGDPA
ncbi:MAG: cupin domain-containing protein [Opitutales bacterium]